MTACNTIEKNPFIKEWSTPYGIPPFSEIKTRHYLPAFRRECADKTKKSMPSFPIRQFQVFSNTIEALDRSGSLLRKVSNVFFTLVENETNDKMNDLAEKVPPLLSEHSDKYLPE